MQQFGRVLAGGIFTSYDNQLRENIVRLFDDAASFQNLSAPAQVLVGQEVIIAEFIVTGTDSKQVVLRGLGPTLTGAGLTGALADPTLQLFDGSGHPMWLYRFIRFFEPTDRR